MGLGRTVMVDEYFFGPLAHMDTHTNTQMHTKTHLHTQKHKRTHKQTNSQARTNKHKTGNKNILRVTETK